MITTVTLNVAVDKSYVVDELRKGEVMRVRKCTNTPGGKGLNVARVIKSCGEDVIATGFIGGHTGALVEDLLKKEQVPFDFTHTLSETRTCINVLDKKGTSTEFLEPGGEISKKEIEDFLERFEKLISISDVVTISGSVPKGVRTDFYVKLITMVKEKGKKVILDTSGDLLKEGIKACPTIIKPNRDEVRELFNLAEDSWDLIIERAKELQSSCVEMVVVSLGKDGALLVTEDAMYHGKPPSIIPINTVGSGDSMVAAFAIGLMKQFPVEDMLRYAISLSAASTLTMKTGSFQEEDRKRIYEEVTITRL